MYLFWLASQCEETNAQETDRKNVVEFEAHVTLTLISVWL